MADENEPTNPVLAAWAQARKTEDGSVPIFPPSQFPVIYADTVPSFSGPYGGIIKFYLGRIDPNFTGLGGFQTTPSAQVVMSVVVFAQTAVFFEAELDSIVDAGHLQREQVEEMRREMREHLAKRRARGKEGQ